MSVGVRTAMSRMLMARMPILVTLEILGGDLRKMVALPVMLLRKCCAMETMSGGRHELGLNATNESGGEQHSNHETAGEFPHPQTKAPFASLVKGSNAIGHAMPHACPIALC